MKKLALVTAAAFLAFSAPAKAVVIDFSVVLTDADGNPAKDPEGKPLTLGRAAMLGLGYLYPDDATVSTEEKIRRGQVALMALEAKKPVDVSVDNVALIKKYIGKFFAPVTILRASVLLEGKPDHKAEPAK